MKRWLMPLIAVAVAASSLDALPKFATRQGAKCQSCHINPSGKGMRSTFGSTYGREELTMTTFKERTDIEEFSPALNDVFTIGMDYRTLFYYMQSTTATSFFQMQGDLYLDLRLNKKFRIYFDKGLYSGFEVFGLAKVLPLDGYVKVGNFIPAYGLRMDDHTLFIRNGPFAPIDPALSAYPAGLGFGQGSEDTGLEVGFNPSIFTFNAGVFNGRKGGLAGAGGSTSKAVAVRGDAAFEAGPFNILLGGSLYRLPTGGGRVTQSWGGFGIVTYDGNLTLMAEADMIQSYNTSLLRTVNGVVIFTEANYVITEGIDLKVGYEFYDPNDARQDASVSRISVGAEFFPLTGVEVRPVYRINRESLTELSNDELHVMFHFFL
ncbi:MAG: hypothetical protein F9K22_06125 [Bacteroidetes bacterium]|nr:MAG: hypothetical protein F9K22_06125 [Bacteroidota bacterium]